MSGPDLLGGLAHEPAEPRAPRHPVRRPAQHRTPFAPSTVALLVVLGAFFAVQVALSPQHDGLDGLLLYRMGSLHAASVESGDVWRLGSYAFLHIGLTHFLVNAVALWMLMRPLEATYGSASTMGIFAFSALAGGAASALHAHYANAVFLQAAGASGGIFGLFGATGSLWIRARHRVPREVLHAALRSLGINLVINVVIAFVAPVDSFAHAGGFVSGVVAGFLAPVAVLGVAGWQRLAQWLLVGSALSLAACEGAAVARAVHPHDRVLRGRGAQAQMPWYLVQVGPGEALSVAGMHAVIYRSPEPVLSAPGAPLAPRAFVDAQEAPEPNALREIDEVTPEGRGRLGLRMICEWKECLPLVEPAADQVARTLRPYP